MTLNMDSKDSSINWKRVKRKLRREKCVLVLGAELAAEQCEEKLFEYLMNELPKEISQKMSADDDFLPLNASHGRHKSHAYELVEDYFEDINEIPKIYQLVAQLPFHLIISLSPDSLLKRAFKNINRPFVSDFFNHRGHNANRENEAKKVSEPSMYRPLIYQLLGSVEEPASLVYTYEDLFHYLEKVLGLQQLPNKVRIALKDAQYYILVGVKFEHWYSRLLMRIINVDENSFSFANYESDVAIARPKKFYEHFFNVEFISDSSQAFLSTLKEKCEDVLEDTPTTIDSQKTTIRVRELIKNGELKTAIDITVSYFEQTGQTSNCQTAIGLLRECKEVNIHEQRRTLSFDKLQIEKNSITSRLQSLISEI